MSPFGWVLRWVITLHALEVFAQAVLAGRFLAGDFDMVELHAVNAIIAGSVGYLNIVAAILYWRPGGGSTWPMYAAIGLSAAETIQILFGFARVIGLHVPLGVSIIVTTTLLAVWAWRVQLGPRPAVSPPGETDQGVAAGMTVHGDNR
jgi:hypothetical protein